MHKIDEVKLVFMTIVLFLLYYSGCRKTIDHRYLTGEVTESEVVGTWMVTDDSLAIIAKNGYGFFNRKEDHILKFLDSNKCIIRTFQAIPPFPKKSEEDRLYVQDEEGTWHIGEATLYVYHISKQVPAVIIKIRDEKMDDSGNIISVDIKTLTFIIGKDKSELILWKYVGDPDYDEYFKFMRIDEPNGRENLKGQEPIL